MHFLCRAQFVRGLVVDVWKGNAISLGMPIKVYLYSCVVAKFGTYVPDSREVSRY